MMRIIINEWDDNNIYIIQKMRNITGKTLIFYTFQSANKSAQFNVTTFKKSAPQQPKIRDVLYQLPLDFDKYSYHFRFKSQFFQNDQKIIGWIDISNLLAKVPVVSSNIFVKILQIPTDQYNKLFNREKLTAIGLINPKGANSNTKQNPVNGQTPKQQMSSSRKQIPKSEQKPQNQAKQVKKASSNLFDLQSPINSSTGNSKTSQQVKQEQVSNVYVPGSETPQQRLQGFQQACKKQEEQRQLQKQAIKVHEIKLTEWGYSGHKTINNLTTLLATLHTIWPEWQPVSLADMLKPEDVTALYKKAVVRLHPDKNVDKDYQTKYLSKRIFQLLNQARKAQK